jgi:hypothetical protein
VSDCQQASRKRIEVMTHARIREFPRGFDWVWLACDRDDHVAAFITGGAGPIPTAILESSLPAEESEALIRRLAPTTTAHASISHGGVESFIALAQRGVFVYDWQDVHRPSARYTHLYELVAAPREPVRVELFHGELAQLSRIVRLDNASFADEMAVDVCRHTQCIADYQGMARPASGEHS